jgi:hypothetical protein
MISDKKGSIELRRKHSKNNGTRYSVTNKEETNIIPDFEF